MKLLSERGHSGAFRVVFLDGQVAHTFLNEKASEKMRVKLSAVPKRKDEDGYNSPNIQKL